MALREALVGLVGIERVRGDEFDTSRRARDRVTPLRLAALSPR